MFTETKPDTLTKTCLSLYFKTHVNCSFPSNFVQGKIQKKKEKTISKHVCEMSHTKSELNSSAETRRSDSG
jgi:hypothetical protein